MKIHTKLTNDLIKILNKKGLRVVGHINGNLYRDGTDWVEICSLQDRNDLGGEKGCAWLKIGKKSKSYGTLGWFDSFGVEPK
jgi:hypothetical protein